MAGLSALTVVPKVGDKCYSPGCHRIVELRYLGRDMCQREWDAFCKAEELREMSTGGVAQDRLDEVVDDRSTMKEVLRDTTLPRTSSPTTPLPSGFGLFLKD